MEKKSRSVLKAITWRMLGTVVLAGVSYLITGSLKHMTLITILFEGIQLVNYYWHERVWLKINWGRIRHPLEELPVRRPVAAGHMEIIRKHLEDWGYIETGDAGTGRKTQRSSQKALPLGVHLKKETAG